MTRFTITGILSATREKASVTWDNGVLSGDQQTVSSIALIEADARFLESMYYDPNDPGAELPSGFTPHGRIDDPQIALIFVRDQFVPGTES